MSELCFDEAMKLHMRNILKRPKNPYGITDGWNGYNGRFMRYRFGYSKGFCVMFHIYYSGWLD